MVVLAMARLLAPMLVLVLAPAVVLVLVLWAAPLFATDRVCACVFHRAVKGYVVALAAGAYPIWFAWRGSAVALGIALAGGGGAACDRDSMVTVTVAVVVFVVVTWAGACADEGAAAGVEVCDRALGCVVCSGS